MAVAFREHQVPVVVADEAYGFVASGRFELEQAWGAQAIEQRVDCGETDDGTPRARLGAVWMEVEARLRPTGDALATARAGLSIGRRPTDVALLGHGAVRIGDDTHDCGLTEAFTREILATAGVQGDVIDRPGAARVIAGRH